MLILVQWATSNPADWISLDLTTNAQIESIPRKPEPRGTGRVLDKNAGWVNAWNCQGVVQEGWDHVGASILANGALEVSCWNDDPIDWPLGQRWAYVWTFLDPAPDDSLPGALRGAVNTRQTVTVYAEDGREGALPFTSFVPPPPTRSWYGVWVSDKVFADHRAAQTVHGWREWIKP